MRKIPLTQGQVALVDDDDYEWLSQWKWYASKRDGGKYIARRNSVKDSGQKITIKMHRLIMGATDPAIGVDHRDHNPLNNQRHNLRLATTAQNNQNRGKQKNNTSGIPGVYWIGNRQKWVAKIQIGSFDTAEEAAAAYDSVSRTIRGEFAPTVVPNV